MGHPSIWSPHIWHVPCPQRNTIFLIRSKQTGHMVYGKLSFVLWIFDLKEEQKNPSTLTCSLISCSCCCNFCTSWILLTFVGFAALVDVPGVAATELFIATPWPALFTHKVSSVSILSSVVAVTCFTNIKCVNERANWIKNKCVVPLKMILRHYSTQ